MKIAHVGIRGREQHADIGRHARENDGLRLEVVEEQIECRVVEAGMLGLEHEVVCLVRHDLLGHGSPADPILETMGNDPVKVVTKETGGEIFDATSGTSITAALTSAVDRLKLRYTLSYAGASAASPSTKGGYHRIEVQLVSRFGKPDTDYTIHSRSGYYDAQERSKVAASRP